MKIIYKIEILNWEKYNKRSKPNMPSVMVSKRFFDDAKMQTLPPSGKLLYLFLLLRRGDVETTIVEASHDDCVTSAGGRGVLVATLLDQLQSLQLLKYEKTSLNRIENKVIENKVIENKPIAEKKEPERPSPPPKKSSAKKVILNFNEFLENINPVIKQNWVELYSAEYLNTQILEAENWTIANPQKSRRSEKGWVSFLSNWFKRSWDNYQKRIPTNKQNAMGIKSL